MAMFYYHHSVQRRAARQALDYVAKIENLGNCSLGTGESLDLIYDHTVWNSYALAAVRLANFITKIIRQSPLCSGSKQRSLEVFHIRFRNPIRTPSVFAVPTLLSLRIQKRE